MEIYILRHAIAEERDPHKYPDDSLRPLTAKGKKRMRRIANGLAGTGISFDIIYTSPLVRARQTANIVAAAFHVRKLLHETKTLAPDGNPEELVHLVNDLKGRVESILLVGHEPYLSDLISVLVAGDSGFLLAMKKGGLCKLVAGTLSYEQCASLEFVLPPSVSVHLQTK